MMHDSTTVINMILGELGRQQQRLLILEAAIHKNPANGVIVHCPDCKAKLSLTSASQLPSDNGKSLEAVMTISDKVALMEGRWAVMDALKASLAEQLAGLLLSGLQFPLRG